MRTSTILIPAFSTLALIALCGGCAGHSRLLVSDELVSTCEGAARLGRPLVVANYNIKSGLWSSLDQVGDVLAKLDADVVALQEVDRGMRRTNDVDQSDVLARRLGMKRIFLGAQDRDGGTYGVALLSRLPIARVTRIDLPGAGGVEPRVAVDADVCVDGRPLRVLATHTDFTPWAAEAQAGAIAEALQTGGDVVVLGDFNATPEKPGIRRLLERPLFDALGIYTTGPTFEGVGRIDYILTDRRVANAEIVEAAASDHKPVLATVEADLDEDEEPAVVLTPVESEDPEG